VVSKPDIEDWTLALKRDGKGVTEANFEDTLKKFDNVTSALIRAAVQPIFDVVFGDLTKAEVQLELLQKFVNLAKSKNAYPVLSIDEANIVLGSGNNATKLIILDLVSLTKQKKELSLILTSSEHAYPYNSIKSHPILTTGYPCCYTAYGINSSLVLRVGSCGGLWRSLVAETKPWL
jgi:hypothetical protein